MSAIGHQVVLRLSGWSRQIHSEFHGLAATRDTAREASCFRLRGCHPLRRTVPGPSPNTTLSYSLSAQQRQLNSPTTPGAQRLLAVTRSRFSLIRFRSPLLTESRLLSLPVGTEMFHFPTFPPHALCVQAWVTGLSSCRVSPFGNPWITAWLTAPQGLSQPPTSFFGSWCPDIHRMPLVA